MSEKITLSTSPHGQEGYKWELNGPYSSSTPVGGGEVAALTGEVATIEAPNAEITTPLTANNEEVPAQPKSDEQIFSRAANETVADIHGQQLSLADEVKYGQKSQEEKRIYENPDEDPAYIEADKRASEVNSSWLKRGYDAWKSQYANDEYNNVWRAFATKYPEKAAAYASHNGAIERVLSEPSKPTPKEIEARQREQFDAMLGEIGSPQVMPMEGQLDLTGEAGWAEDATASSPKATEPTTSGRAEMAAKYAAVPDFLPGEADAQARQAAWLAEHPESDQVYREQFDIDADGNRVVTREATIKPEDLPAIEARSEELGLNMLDGQRGKVAEAWASLDKLRQETEDNLRQRAVELGVLDSDTPLDSPQYAEFRRDIIETEIGKAWAGAAQRIVESTFPIMPDVGRRERKAIEQQRQAMHSLLAISIPDLRAEVLQTWEAHDQINQAFEMDALHAEALKDDKKIKAGEKVSEARGAAEQLNARYGNALEQVANLPLFRELGAELANGKIDAAAKEAIINIIKAYQERLGMVANGTEREMVIRKATKDLGVQLGERLTAMGVEPAQVEATTKAAQKALDQWVRNIPPKADAVGDLEKYLNSRNSEQLWGAKRRRAAEYLGAKTLKRVLDRIVPEPRIDGVKVSEFANPETPLDKRLGEVRQALGMAIDPSGDSRREGASYLIDPSKAPNYRKRLLAQLGLARQLGRHQGTLMKSALLFSAAGREVGYGASEAWEAMDGSEKMKAMKRYMLGKAVAGRGLAARGARAAGSKAKEVTVTLGNVTKLDGEGKPL